MLFVHSIKPPRAKSAYRHNTLAPLPPIPPPVGISYRSDLTKMKKASLLWRIWPSDVPVPHSPLLFVVRIGLDSYYFSFPSGYCARVSKAAFGSDVCKYILYISYIFHTVRCIIYLLFSCVCLFVFIEFKSHLFWRQRIKQTIKKLKETGRNAGTAGTAGETPIHSKHRRKVQSPKQGKQQWSTLDHHSRCAGVWLVSYWWTPVVNAQPRL